MIPRYNSEPIAEIWSNHKKFSYYLRVELSVLKNLEGKLIPLGVSKLFDKVKIDPSRIEEIERVTKHDVIAFCTSITEQVSNDNKKYFHYGVTSSDIIDTALGLQIKDSLAIILPNLKNLLTSLKLRSKETKDVICIGRSHGMYAEPMSFGQKLLGFYAEFLRRYEDLNSFYQNDITGKISGAVGNYTIMPPEVEAKILQELGLKRENVSTQIVPRDRLAKLASLFGLLGCTIERLCIELRHLHHSDINELHEGFSKGQKGSSIMPHKKNPITSENLTGISRMLRSYVQVAMDNTLLWHERDISHSSAERLYLPDMFGLADYALKRLDQCITSLVFNIRSIESKTQKDMSYLSSYILHLLINDTDKSREELYPVVQEISFHIHQYKDMDSKELSKLINDALEKNGLKTDLTFLKNLDLKAIYLKHTNSVFDRFN